MTRLLAKIAKTLLRAFPAYPGPDYLPHEKITVESAAREARVAYDDERESRGAFLRFFGDGLKLEGETILDLGSGFGGRAIEFQRVIGGHLIGLEARERTCIASSLFARAMGARKVSFVTGLAELLPFSNDTIDLILCYDVLEHVQDPERTMAEAYRVMKPGGLFMVVFPPYFHPTGAHLEGYISRVPYMNLMFPSKVLLLAIDQILADRSDGYHPQPLRPGDKLYGLNGTTIRSFRRMLKRSRFEVAQLEFLPLLTKMNRKYDAWHMRYYAWMSYLPSRVPILQELFVHRIVAAMRKPVAPSSKNG